SRRRHTRFSRDWSSDVCSSDLLLRSRAEAQGDAVAVVGMDQRWTYGELLQKAETAAAGFLALGLKPGDRVVVQLPNLPEFLSVRSEERRVGQECRARGPLRQLR